MEFLASMLIDTAWAQDGGGQPSALPSLILPVVLIAVFYFLLIRPQQKKQKEHRQMVADLGAGDEVVTGGGVLGKVTAVGDQFLTIEIADNVKVKVQKSTIMAVMPQGTVKSA